jgi:hypothetical protein
MRNRPKSFSINYLHSETDSAVQSSPQGGPRRNVCHANGFKPLFPPLLTAVRIRLDFAPVIYLL